MLEGCQLCNMDGIIVLIADVRDEIREMHYIRVSTKLDTELLDYELDYSCSF